LKYEVFWAQVGDTVVIPEYGGVTLNFEKEEIVGQLIGQTKVLGVGEKPTNLRMERHE